MRTLNMTGFGGGYEQNAQVMLTRGLKWASERKEVADVKYVGYEDVYGIVYAIGVNAKALDAAMLADHIDATGAMHQCVVENLLFILKKGYDAWLEAGSVDDRMDRIDPDREAAVEELRKFKNEAFT